jgi:transposase InsO family protein
VDSSSRHILTFQDDLNKFLVGIPIERQDSETVVREFVLNIILKFDTPRQVLTDQGTDFDSNLFKETCKLLRIKKIQCSAFHPESNGGLERSHRVLAEYLRHYVREDQSDWDQWIPYATYVYITTVHMSTGYTALGQK